MCYSLKIGKRNGMCNINPFLPQHIPCASWCEIVEHDTKNWIRNYIAVIKGGVVGVPVIPLTILQKGVGGFRYWPLLQRASGYSN